MTEILSLLIYWSVAVALIGTGIYALNRGFKLILDGKGKTREESTIQIFGFKATLGSLGGLAMVTALLWGFMAYLVLPDYKDVTIRKLRSTLDIKEGELDDLENNLTESENKIMGLITTLQHLPPVSNEWVEYHNEHPIQLYVTDYSGRALMGTTTVVSRTGEEVVTDKGGLTPIIWTSLGDKVLLNKDNFQLNETVIDRENIRSRVLSIKLRRIEDVEEKVLLE